MPISNNQNYLAIDYGTKRLGLAYSISGIIFTLPSIANDQMLFDRLKEVIEKYQIVKIYLGISQGWIAKQCLKFVDDLSGMLKLPVETIEEAVSTIEATEIFHHNLKKKKDYKKLVDSISAAVILRRVINFS